MLPRTRQYCNSVRLGGIGGGFCDPGQMALNHRDQLIGFILIGCIHCISVGFTPFFAGKKLRMKAHRWIGQGIRDRFGSGEWPGRRACDMSAREDCLEIYIERFGEAGMRPEVSGELERPAWMLLVG